MKLASLVSVAGAAMLLATPTLAADFTVNMVNKDSEGRNMQFEPAFLSVAPGDTVTFKAVDKGHDSESLPDGIPDGAESWKGQISQDVTVTLTQPGLYAFKCTPHFALGMVGLIEVGGDQSNLDAIKALRFVGKAKARMDELIGQIGAAQ
jgi:pseudoazurin